MIIINLVNNNFIKFENDVMQKILHEDNALYEQLSKQYKCAVITNREFSGCGFFTKFNILDESLRLKDFMNIELGNTRAIIEGIKNGIGFVLFIRNGFITTLEGYTYDDKWPDNISDYQLI